MTDASPLDALSRLAEMGGTVRVSGRLDERTEEIAVAGELEVVPLVPVPLETLERAVRVLEHVSRGRRAAFANGLYPDAAARRALAEVLDAAERAGVKLHL